MKIIFLLAPSEGKNPSGNYNFEKVSFLFEKPYDISINASEKDLKCKGKRYLEAIKLNKELSLQLNHINLNGGRNTFLDNRREYNLPINRYSGVMYNAINYNLMSNNAKKYFQDNFLILSGMYGLLRPLDIIGNYKLPIETKGLLKFWGNKISNKLNEINADYIVNLLPLSYNKMINIDDIKSKTININFLKPDGKKISHGVKKFRGEWVKNICDNNIINYKDFPGKIIDSGNKIDVNIAV